MKNSWTLYLDGQSLPEKNLIGGKAWSIAWMKSLGLPVPPAFVITTKACLHYLDTGEFPDGLESEILEKIGVLESNLGRQFGGEHKPLLLSVRSGAAISMPGMMDTVLNLGINDGTELSLAQETGSDEFARDTHRRFYELYSSIVLKVPALELDPEVPPAVWRDNMKKLGAVTPESVMDQLRETVLAVFNSWNTRRAKRYRDHNGIPHDLGTAVTVQAMVFGNLDDQSGTGVLFSRNPLTGEKAPYGEYLARAQGEDVVSGKFTPLPLEAMNSQSPGAFDQLLAASATLEKENKDVQDIEFTVQQGQLFLLQARSAKRAPAAAVRIAVDMVEEGLISETEAVKRVTPEQIQTLLLPRLAEGAAEGAIEVLRGEGACPGVATGIVVTDPDEADKRASEGEDVILARKTTSPDDVHGMIAAKGVITEMGGSTSHAAVVSRALGRPCVVGVGDGGIDKLAGQVVTIEGGAGKVFAGGLQVIVPDEESDALLSKLIAWSRKLSPVTVMPFADAEGKSDVVDLDSLLEDSDSEISPAQLVGLKAVSGNILATEKVTRMAIAAGITTFYAKPVLPCLLSSLENNP